MFTDLQCSDHSKDTDCIKLETKRGDTVWQFQQNIDRLLQRPSGQCEPAGQGHAGRRKWSVTRTDQNSIVGQILCSLRAERSIVMQTHYQPSCFVTPDSVLFPSPPPLSLRPILSWSIFNMWQWITSQLPCLVPQEISWLKTATSPTWWLCVGITTHHIMCTSLNSNSCREMVTSWLVTICSAQISSHNSQWAGLGQNIWKLSIPIILFNC